MEIVNVILMISLTGMHVYNFRLSTDMKKVICEAGEAKLEAEKALEGYKKAFVTMKNKRLKDRVERLERICEIQEGPIDLEENQKNETASNSTSQE